MISLTEQEAVSQSNDKTAGELFSWDNAEFQRCFTREPFYVKHQLSQHPLFETERLLELAQQLPASNIEYNAGNIPVSISHQETPLNGLSPEETIRRIAECKSWLVMKYIEDDPAYKDLLHACLEEFAPFTEPIAPGMMKPHAFVFITSPKSVTPFHIDPEHNFLLQIKGSKIIRMYDGNDPTILSNQELEDFYCDRGRNLVMQEANKERCWTHRLNPGEGLHFPVTFPHWVENGEEVSISFSITFRTPDLDKRRALYRTNSTLRSWGMNPRKPGEHRFRDAVCYNAFRTLRKVNTALGRE